MEEIYSVKKLKNNEEFTITVPGSKSVTNRALMLAALAKENVFWREYFFQMIQGHF